MACSSPKRALSFNAMLSFVVPVGEAAITGFYCCAPSVNTWRSSFVQLFLSGSPRHFGTLPGGSCTHTGICLVSLPHNCHWNLPHSLMVQMVTRWSFQQIATRRGQRSLLILSVPPGVPPSAGSGAGPQTQMPLGAWQGPDGGKGHRRTRHGDLYAPSRCSRLCVGPQVCRCQALPFFKRS